MPKKIHVKAKWQIQQIRIADTKENEEKAPDEFSDIYGVKYPKAIECLKKDRDELLSFYDFPAEHWAHLRTTNPIESTFAEPVWHQMIWQGGIK